MPPSTIADRYHVLRELGRGGMGVVYQVLHKESGRQYALKLLASQAVGKGESVERFKREVKLPSRIKSEHVVQVFDSGLAPEENDAPFYVMELLRGCDLRHLLESKHAFTAQEIIWILRQVAAGLEQAHAAGIVHRDLKPDNIFLHCQEGSGLVVKVLDFGIARYAQELLNTGDKAKLTATQAMLGTPLYMAPEQAKSGEGRSEIGPCTDAWALGMIAFELLTGKTYWNADSLVQHLGQLLFAEMAPASQRADGLPAGFDAWFARACSRDTGQRYKSVGEEVGDLARVLLAQDTDSPPPVALLQVVKAQLRPLVDHQSPTMITGMPGAVGRGGQRDSAQAKRASSDAATRVLAPNQLLGSAEQNLRAEIINGDAQSWRPWPFGASGARLRAMLGGALALGAALMTWGIMQRAPQTPAQPLGTDMGITPQDLAPAQDLALPPTQGRPDEPSGARKPPAGDSGRNPPSKPSKPRRTYVPPQL